MDFSDIDYFSLLGNNFIINLLLFVRVVSCITTNLVPFFFFSGCCSRHDRSERKETIIKVTRQNVTEFDVSADIARGFNSVETNSLPSW